MKQIEEIEKRTREEILRIVRQLTRRIEKELPETGEFGLFYEEFKHPNPKAATTDIMLQVKAFPDEMRTTDKAVYLELRCYSLPLPYVATKILESGTKHDLVAYLKRPEVPGEVHEKAMSLDKMLDSELGDMIAEARSSRS